MHSKMFVEAINLIWSFQLTSIRVLSGMSVGCQYWQFHCTQCPILCDKIEIYFVIGNKFLLRLNSRRLKIIGFKDYQHSREHHQPTNNSPSHKTSWNMKSQSIQFCTIFQKYQIYMYVLIAINCFIFLFPISRAYFIAF